MADNKPDEDIRTSSVTLCILDDQMEPGFITNLLGFDPDQSWKLGDSRISPGGKTQIYSSSGWKLFQPKVLDTASLEDQLDFWLETCHLKGMLSKK